ncbi:MAG: SEC-C domain-containing protein [Fibrobacteria bacterium]|nr:SEC-C domain-containing protein [Fibrobacteria bacterium]
MPEADALCPCQSGKAFAACCARFADAPHLSGSVPVARAHASLRRHLLDLCRSAADLPELWFACLDEFTDPEREALGTVERLQQPFLDHFIWDWFRKYSEARPIARIARTLETTDLRQATRLDQWSLSPWQPWEILGARGGTWEVRRLGTDHVSTIQRTFPSTSVRKGDGAVFRLLPHLGHEFAGLSVMRFAGARGLAGLEHSWDEICRTAGIRPSTKLRPDVHNELWHSVHMSLLHLHPDLHGLEPAVSSTEPTPLLAQELEQVVADLAHQTPLQAATHEMGRHRLRRWLDRRMQSGEDVSALRQALGI